MCIEYPIQVNMYHVSAQGFDERMVNYYYYIIIIINCQLTDIFALCPNGSKFVTDNSSYQAFLL